jgi:phage antirepressor YoqD-like protein
MVETDLTVSSSFAMNAPLEDIMAVFQQAVELSKERGKLLDEAMIALQQSQRKITKQAEEIEANRPKVEVHDALVEAKHLTNFRETAKEIGVPQDKFIQLLIGNKFVFRDSKGNLRPRAEYVNGQHFFEEKEYINQRNGHVGLQTFITFEGRVYFARKWGKLAPKKAA